MSLILKGSPSETIYREDTESNYSSSDDISVYLSFIPSPNVSTPFIFLGDRDLDAAPRGFYIRQDSPTLATVGWVTSNGNNEYQFSVTQGEVTHLVAHYDIANQVIDYYVSGITPDDTKASVGTPVDSSKFCLRITSSLVVGEDVVLGDLATWLSGAPSAQAISAIFNDQYVGHAFKSSGCTDKYVFANVNGVLAETFTSIARSNKFIDIERKPNNGDPFSTTGEYLPVVLREYKSQVSAGLITDWERQHGSVDYILASRISLHTGDGAQTHGVLIEDLSEHYDPVTDTWISLPEYPNKPGWMGAIEFRIQPLGTDVTRVLTWEGVATFAPALNNASVTSNQPNRIEFVGGSIIRFLSLGVDGVSNIRCFDLENESVIDSGRLFSPKALGYMGRYDVIRPMDTHRANTNRLISYDDYQDYRNCSLSGAEPHPRIMIQMALEADTELWYNIPQYIGCTRKIVEGEDMFLFGEEQIAVLRRDVIDDYFDQFIRDLGIMKWPLDKNISMELGNEFWNGSRPFSVACNYGQGITNWLKSNGYPSANFLSGQGYLSTLFMDSFQKALIRAGREAQVWTPIIGLWTGSTGTLGGLLLGIDAYLDEEGTIFDKTRYTPATTGYSYSDMEWKADNDWLGQTYANSTDYYTELKSRIDTDVSAVKQIYLKSQLNDTVSRQATSVENQKIILSADGITNPIQQYEGSNHNTIYSSIWETDTVLNDFLNEYNNGPESAAVQRVTNETFVYHNPDGAISNYYTLGTNDEESAWYEGSTWEEMYTSPVGSVWLDYISDTPPDLDTIWSNYLLSPSQGTNVTIDPVAVANDHTLLSMTTADLSRNLGSLFNSDLFDDINFEGAEFFYKPVVDDTSYSPVLENGNFTGYLDIIGDINVVTTVYLHDVVNDDWYEFDFVTSGGGLTFTKYNYVNVTPDTQLDIIGTIYGNSGISLTGPNLTFSNDGGSTWNPTGLLINGTTQYKRTITTNPGYENLTTYTLTINDGVNDHSETVDVITMIEGSAQLHDYPSLTMIPVPMSDGGWGPANTDTMKIRQTPSGTGQSGVKKYHDIVKFIRHPKSKTLTIQALSNPVNAVAASVFDDKYLELTPNSSAPTSVDVTLTDGTVNSISFTYNVSVE